MDSLELYRNGTLIEKTVADYDHQTVQIWRLQSQVMTLVEERAMTATELAKESATAVEKTVYERVQRAVESNRAFLGLTSPTNAQTLAQVKNLTRQMIALVKQQLREFSDQ